MTPRGFLFSAVNAGIKSSDFNGLDLGLVYCEGGFVLSGMFTTNAVKAAPVLIAREQACRGRARAVIANSGNANACTGDRGLEDARAVMRAVSGALGTREDEVVPMSTGTIGVYMPTERIMPRLRPLVSGLSDDPEPFARSIMTTDTVMKVSRRRVGRACILGIAKGAGMIAPDMATTLALVLTDAALEKPDLDRMLRDSVAHTFNAISIDGDMSTNDTILACSSGMAKADKAEFACAMDEVVLELAHMIVRDGEGATKFVTVSVTGSADDGEAKAVARTVADSLLVKTALFGADPNWGRIVAAAGRSGAGVDPSAISVRIQGLNVVSSGVQDTDFSEQGLHEAMLSDEITIDINVGHGPGRFTLWTTDLSCRYVEINASYRT
jgi:glutamate N-acetyltransferase/amino-acid N-acetyltransferase